MNQNAVSIGAHFGKHRLNSFLEGMPPLGATMTTVVNTTDLVAATPYNDDLRKASVLRTQRTCDTMLLTSSSSSSNSSSSTMMTSTGGTMSGTHHLNSTTVDASVATTTMDSPTVTTPQQQQPRRNLTKAFEALCVTTTHTTLSNNDDYDGETRKEEKSDVFDGPMMSPVSVVTADPTTRSSFKTDAALDAVEDPSHSPTATMETTTLPNSTPLNAVPPPAPLLTTTWSVPDLQLHSDLRLRLSLYTVERVSCYCIIHDINKEAAAMAMHDPLLWQQQHGLADTESQSPLVTEGRGSGAPPPSSTLTPGDLPSAGDYALLDEEKWLLASISSRSSQETATITSTKCPATFLQAMGEKEYDLTSTSTTTTTTSTNNSTTNTTSSVTRTQLWKPSRSWWEAKSGKNPWIEPSSHNKRWRYLWPLIHYHKFVHKCIKKLKRNGVDVKTSFSPVSVFLREEVCAVSDHLATVSLFGSEKWMDCLEHFDGWTDLSSKDSISKYQRFVQSLPLRSIQEPVDVDSPLLRNQIDEAFLRTIAMQRDSTTAYHPQNSTPSVASTKVTRNQPGTTAATTNSSATGRTTSNGGPPPVYPHAMTHIHHLYQHNALPVPRQINGVPRSRYHVNGWYQGHVHPGWENLPIDASSVHSELSANSYPQPASHHHHAYLDTATVAAQASHYHMYPLAETTMYYQQHPPQAVPPAGQSAATIGQCAPSETSHSTGYTYPEQYGGWMDPTMAAFAMHHPQYYPSPTHYYGMVGPSTSVYPSPPVETSVTSGTDENQPDSSESETEANEMIGETPYKYNMDQSYMMQSPNWSHLDQATLAMGLATPASTPRRTAVVNPSTTTKPPNQVVEGNSITEDETSITMTENDDEYPITDVNPYAVGPIYAGQRRSANGNNKANYYSTLENNTTSTSARNVAVPPSPATQFMMSPQASFAYNYGYGISPARIISSTSRGATGSSRQRYSTSVGPATTTKNVASNERCTDTKSTSRSVPLDKNGVTTGGDAIVSSTSTE